MAAEVDVSLERRDLPRWDLTALFPGLESPEFDAAFARLLEDIERLGNRFGAADAGAGPRVRLSDTLVAEFDGVLSAMNDVELRIDSMTAYLYGFVTTDSRNELAQARFSALRERMVTFSKLQTRFTAWVGALPLDELIVASPLAAAHSFPLQRLQTAASHLMSEPEESLAAEMAPSAGSAWARLHGNLTSQISARVDVEGEPRTLPMSEIRNLAMNPDRERRRRAWEVELTAWEAHEVPLAAALNGVKGHVLTLGARRGWDDPLGQALFESAIDRETLDALLSEALDSLPEFRRYLQSKAKALGEETLPWYDLFAPMGAAERAWTWPEATSFIVNQFGAYSGRLADLARRAFAERWIDAGPRPGKAGGAYCMWLIGDQSRILANYSQSYDGVSTLAHELGHAYHNLNETGLTPLQRRTPMILAETASTFCETIVKEAALAEAGRGERLYILEQSLQGSCQIVVDILSRFDFEQALFAGRRERELAPGELSRLMLDAQERTYGDGLSPDARHPYMWAVKGHYYSPDRSYYNFPYLFGLLFGLGLYARYLADPDTFPERYDALLASTGRASAADLAARFEIDIRSRDFWRSSLNVLRNDISRFEELVGE
jgi:pepF/M3 family oligoendopeptidase